MLLDVIKDGELVDTHELSASKRVYKVGRQAGVADIVLTHGSVSPATGAALAGSGVAARGRCPSAASRPLVGSSPIQPAPGR